MTAHAVASAVPAPIPELINVPVIETARLRMRAPCVADFEIEKGYWASDRSGFTGGPKTPPQAWRVLAVLVGHWSMRGYGWWTLEARDTGRLLGRVGLWFPEGWPEPELGWTLFEGAEGQGYATEAAGAARAHAYETLGWGTVISLIDADNVRSQAVARRLGARPEGEFDHFGEWRAEIWRHPSPEATGQESGT